MWTADQIKDLLLRNDKAVCRGITRIFERQTADEQNAEFTKHHNGVGFSACDGTIMSSFAKQIKRWESAAEKKYNSPLSPKQMGIARKRIVKYARQLAEIANTAEG